MLDPARLCDGLDDFTAGKSPPVALEAGCPSLRTECQSSEKSEIISCWPTLVLWVVVGETLFIDAVNSEREVKG